MLRIISCSPSVQLAAVREVSVNVDDTRLPCVDIDDVFFPFVRMVFLPRDFTDSDPLTLYFNTIVRNTDFKKWFFGHYHDNRQIMSRWVMLYEQVVRIW